MWHFKHLGHVAVRCSALLALLSQLQVSDVSAVTSVLQCYCWDSNPGRLSLGRNKIFVFYALKFSDQNFAVKCAGLSVLKLSFVFSLLTCLEGTRIFVTHDRPFLVVTLGPKHFIVQITNHTDSLSWPAESGWGAPLLPRTAPPARFPFTSHCHSLQCHVCWDSSLVHFINCCAEGELCSSRSNTTVVLTWHLAPT